MELHAASKNSELLSSPLYFNSVIIQCQNLQAGELFEGLIVCGCAMHSALTCQHTLQCSITPQEVQMLTAPLMPVEEVAADLLVAPQWSLAAVWLKRPSWRACGRVDVKPLPPPRRQWEPASCQGAQGLCLWWDSKLPRPALLPHELTAAPRCSAAHSPATHYLRPSSSEA